MISLKKGRKRWKITKTKERGKKTEWKKDERKEREDEKREEDW